MSSNQYRTIEELESLLRFGNENGKLNLETELLHLKFVGVIEDLMKKQRMSRTELAERLSVSSGYITQLFAGDKLFTFKMLVKLQQVMDFQFKVEAVRKCPSFAVVSNKRFKKRFSPDLVKKGKRDLKYKAEQPHRTLVA